MVILLAVMVFYIVLGTFLDMIAAMFLTLPIILPAMEALGFNLIWFGVLTVHLCEMALITPPFGLNLFVMKSVIPGAELKEVIQGVGPFFLVDLPLGAVMRMVMEGRHWRVTAEQAYRWGLVTEVVRCRS